MIKLQIQKLILKQRNIWKKISSLSYFYTKYQQLISKTKIHLNYGQIHWKHNKII